MNRTLYWFKAALSAPAPSAGVRLLTILASAAMLYQEYPPSPALRAHVACFWTSHAGGLARPHTQRVLPDNCVDILWQDGGQPGFAVGMMRASIDVVTAGPVRTVAVRFKPGAADALKSPSARPPDWAQLALDCGYFDQSYLIHDFQEFAGNAPERFLSAR